MKTLLKNFNRGLKPPGRRVAFTAMLALALAVGANSAAFHIRNIIPLHPPSLEHWNDDVKGRGEGFRHQSDFEGAEPAARSHTDAPDSRSAAGAQSRLLIRYITHDSLPRIAIPGR